MTSGAGSMIEKHDSIQTADGPMQVFMTCPEEGGPFPVVLFYMDSFGLRDELRGMARRIAAAGYYVLLPDLYYRQPRESGSRRATRSSGGIPQQPQRLTVAMVMQDTAAMLAYVDAQPEADSRRLGAVGYCMSGAFVLAAAGSYPGQVKCAASIYGVDLVTEGEDSPHLLAGRIRGELYFAAAERDEYVPAGVIDQLDAHLRASGTNYRIECYPGALHGFAFPERGDAYAPESAERHWVRLLALLDRNLSS